MANRGQPKKSKRGKPRDESVDPKLSAIQRRSKLHKNLYVKKLGEGVKTGKVSQSKNEETSMKTVRENEEKRAMTEAELRERRKVLSKEHREMKKEEQKQIDISRKRQGARNSQWEQKRQMEEERESKKSSKKESTKYDSKEVNFKSERSWRRSKEGLRRLLPHTFATQLEMLSMTVSHFPQCQVTSSKLRLPSREGKSNFYDRLRCRREQFQLLVRRQGSPSQSLSTSQTGVVHNIRVVTALQTFVPVLSESLAARTSKLLFIILRAMKENLSQTLQVLTSRFDGMGLF